MSLESRIISFAQAVGVDMKLKEPALTPGTAAQYLRGDKTWQALDASAVPYKSASVKTALDNLTGSGGTSLPFITGENELFLDECASLSGWTTTAGTVTVVGSEFHMDTLTTVERPFVPPASGDYVWYTKLRAASVSSGYAYVDLRRYSGGQIPLVTVILGYNYVAESPQAGCISFTANGETQSGVLATEYDYSVSTQIAVHVDRDRATINFFIKEVSGKWALKGTAPYFSGVETGTHFSITRSGSNPAMTFDVDRIVISRPNIVAIGDSIYAGHNHFDPSPSFHAGLDDNASAIWKHVQIASGYTNDLVVNKGIGAQSSSQILARITEATGHGAKLIFLEASANDYGTVGDSTRTSNMQSCVSAIAASGAHCIVTSAVYVNASYGGTAAAHNAYMKNWWDVSRLGLVGVAQYMDITIPVADGTGAIATANVEADGIHPNAVGYGLIGAYITDTIGVVVTPYTGCLVTDAEKSAWDAKQGALVSGTDIKTVNGASLLGAGNIVLGLVNFTEAINTAAPNATVPVVALSAVSEATDADLALVSKGLGALIVGIPDNTASGGNKRGLGAVDLQVGRALAAQVAAGSYSAVLGGQNNSASASFSIAAGRNSSASGVIGKKVWGTGAEFGKNQTGQYLLVGDTTNTTAKALSTNGGTQLAYSSVYLPANTSFYVRLRAVARNTSTGASKSWAGLALIRRGATVATTELVETPLLVSDFADAALASASLSLTADTTVGCLSVNATGIASTTIRWLVHVEAIEVAS